MSFIGEWIQQIVLLILMATFLDLILPNSSMRKYVKLVVGFLLILIILSPVLKLFQFDHEQLLQALDASTSSHEEPMSASVRAHEEKIEEMQQSYVLEEASRTWRDHITQKIEQTWPVSVAGIEIALEVRGEDIELEGLKLTLAQAVKQTNTSQEGAQAEYKGQEDEDDISDDAVTIEPVEPVNVNINENLNGGIESEAWTKEQKNLQKEVLKFVQDEWNISVDKINIAWQRGGDS
ncbi:stage III sporulation protein AF [Caldalkalibacillus salinus]|uniref:stage III sporulation protein AF n=1 Tax=Caldalkalibacillus salinus TaxID=2803787 RepID=UPI0019210028|nr:stage III sporulation protein AF [Caldalkalibacillus salinus]